MKVGVLDYKKCEDNVKPKHTDSHIHGASLMQISALYLSKVLSERLMLVETKATEAVLNTHQALARLRFK
jgi:hypothetical protein